MSHDNKVKTYRLWHHQFAHLSAAKLYDLYKIITLSKSILIVKNNVDVCKICALTKFVNQWEHNISERKANIFALIFINICEPLSLLFTDYFLKIIDNHLQKIWIISLKQQDNVSQKLQKWWLKVKLQFNAKILAVQSNNATELRFILNEWCMSFNIVSQYTVLLSQVCNEINTWLIIFKYKKNTMKRKRRASYRSKKIMCFSLKVLVSN